MSGGCQASARAFDKWPIGNEVQGPREQLVPILDMRVEFFHRTVKDYLKTEWSRKEILSKSSLQTNPDTYRRLRLAEAKCANSPLALCLETHAISWDALERIYQGTLEWLHRIDECEEFSRILFSSRCFLNRRVRPDFPEPDISGHQLPAYWPKMPLRGVAGDDFTCNMLLLAAVIPHAVLVEQLLQSGGSPNDEIEVKCWHIEGEDTKGPVKVTVWTTFLRLFALEV